MNTKHLSLASAVLTLAVLLTGCAKNPIEKQQANLELSNVSTNETKAVIDGTVFPQDGHIGLFLFKDEAAVSPYGGTGCSNVEYSYNETDGKWTAGTPIKVGGEPGCLYGYYPYNSSVTDIKAIPVSSSLNGDDVMYATKQTVTDKNASQTAIKMNHALARVTITVVNNGYTLGEGVLSSIKFSGAEASMSGILDATSGIISGTTKADVILDVPSGKQLITAEGTVYECLLVPSEEESLVQTLDLTLNIDGDDKTTILSGDTGVNIARNTKSNITLALSNSGISVQTVSVEDWNVVEVGGHRVTVILSEDDDDIADDVLTSVKVDENTVEILALSLSENRLECVLTGTAEVTRDIDDLDNTFTFTISDIGSDVTATIGYDKPLNVTVSTNNPKWGSASFEGECYKGETITFTATASKRHQFVEWHDADGNKLDWENPQDITLTSDLVVEAIFEITKIPGALPGKFIVGPGPDGISGTDDDKMVHFSKGNLQARYSDAVEGRKRIWSFAAHQYDHIGNNPGNTTIKNPGDNDIVDLFGWSSYAPTITYGICADDYYEPYSGNFLDWGTTIDDEETWRTLSIEEWGYLIKHGYESNHRIDVTVVGCDHCFVLYPIGYDRAKMVNDHDKETYNTEAAYNAATEEGVVFLPPTGYRIPDNFSGRFNDLDRGFYWTNRAGVAFHFSKENDFAEGVSMSLKYGMAVRLVTDCE